MTDGFNSITNAQVKIKKGAIFIYRLFDVAEDINVNKVEQILQDKRGPDRFKVPKFIDRAIIMNKPPISFGFGEVLIHLKDKVYKADVLVKIRDFGVLSLIYQINLEKDFSWSDLVKLAYELEEGSEIDSLAEKQCGEILQNIGDALKKPTQWKSFEDYIVYFIEEFSDGVSASDLLKKVDITKLIIAEDKLKISEQIRKSTLENLFQYSDNDLALIEWNSALVIEPGGGREVPDILEFAVTHLLEMRYYDELLDDKLKILYEDIEKGRTKIFSSTFDKVYADASSRYIEFSDFIERVENSLKVVGDFYLATLYRAATRRFRLGDWQQNVTRKMNLLAQVSSLLQGEVNIRRSHLLEMIIILLIAYEIFMAIWK